MAVGNAADGAGLGGGASACGGGAQVGPAPRSMPAGPPAWRAGRLALHPALEPVPGGGLHVGVELVRGVVQAAGLAIARRGLLVAGFDFGECRLDAIGVEE